MDLKVKNISPQIIKIKGSETKINGVIDFFSKIFHISQIETQPIEKYKIINEVWEYVVPNRIIAIKIIPEIDLVTNSFIVILN